MKEEERLKECLLRNEVPVIRQEKRNTLEQLVREEQQKIRLLPKVTIVKKFFLQAEYISPWAWLLQIFAVVLTIGILIAGENNEKTLLATAAPFVGIALFPELVKSFHYDMWELEQSCRFNLREIMVMKFLIFGIADLATVVILGVVAGNILSVTWIEMVLYFLIPLQLAKGGSLRPIRLGTLRCSGYMLFAVGLLQSAMAGFYALYVECLSAWIVQGLAAAGSVISTALCIYMIAKIVKIGSQEQVGRFVDAEHRREHIWN